MTEIPEPCRSDSPEQALAHIVEEAGEMLAAAGKTLRFGFASYNPALPEHAREINIHWLRREIADLERAIAAFRAQLSNAGWDAE